MNPRRQNRRLAKPLPLFVGVCVGLAISVQCAYAQKQYAPPYSLRAIHVTTINQYDNSQRVVPADDDFWNALGLSVLVSVEVHSEKSDVYRSERKVEIKAYEGDRLIDTFVGDIGYIRQDSYYVPLLLHGPFCQTLRIEARLVGQSQASAISRKLAFACGE